MYLGLEMLWSMWTFLRAWCVSGKEQQRSHMMIDTETTMTWRWF